MHTDPLVKMANQIAAFLTPCPTAPKRSKAWRCTSASSGCRMRQRFLAHVDSGGAGLHPLVLQAVQAHRRS